jgi:DNA-binding beta-propeller fold protein YncE
MERARLPLNPYALAILLLLAPTPFLLSTTTAGGADAQPRWSSIPLGTVPRGVAIDPQSGTVYTVMYLNGTTFAIDPSTQDIVAKIQTPSPYAVAVDSKTDRVYVSQGTGSSISVVDGSSDKVVSVIQGAGIPYALAVDETRDLIFAADTGANALWVINGSTDTIVARVHMGSTSALAVDPLAGEAFIGNLSSNLQNGSIDVINESDPAGAVRTVQVPFPPMHFSVDPALHLLFVTSGGSSSGTSPNFIAIDDENLSEAYAVGIGGASPDLTAVSPSQGVYVSDTGNGRIYELDEKNGQLVENLSALTNSSVGATGEVTAMAVDSSTGKLYVTETDDPALLVLSPPPLATPVPGVSIDRAYFAIIIVVVVAAVVIPVVISRRRSAAAKAAKSRSTKAG